MVYNKIKDLEIYIPMNTWRKYSSMAKIQFYGENLKVAANDS